MSVEVIKQVMQSVEKIVKYVEDLSITTCTSTTIIDTPFLFSLFVFAAFDPNLAAELTEK